MDKLSQCLNSFQLKVGPGPSKSKEDKYKCPYCQDRGIIIQGEVAYRCQCVRHQAALKRFASANLTPFLASHTFDKFDLKYYSPHLSHEKDGPSLRAMAEKAFQGAKEFVAGYLEQKNGTGLF
jgi:DNA replication protein DnaC